MRLKDIMAMICGAALTALLASSCVTAMRYDHPRRPPHKHMAPPPPPHHGPQHHDGHDHMGPRPPRKGQRPAMHETPRRQDKHDKGRGRRQEKRRHKVALHFVTGPSADAQAREEIS